MFKLRNPQKHCTSQPLISLSRLPKLNQPIKNPWINAEKQIATRKQRHPNLAEVGNTAAVISGCQPEGHKLSHREGRENPLKNTVPKIETLLTSHFGDEAKPYHGLRVSHQALSPTMGNTVLWVPRKHSALSLVDCYGQCCKSGILWSWGVSN